MGPVFSPNSYKPYRLRCRSLFTTARCNINDMAAILALTRIHRQGLSFGQSIKCYISTLNLHCVPSNPSKTKKPALKNRLYYRPQNKSCVAQRISNITSVSHNVFLRSFLPTFQGSLQIRDKLWLYAELISQQRHQFINKVNYFPATLPS